MKLSALLSSLSACDEAREWAKPYATLQEAWDACPRSDWMMWFLTARGTHAEQRQALAYQFADRAVRVHSVAALRSAGLTAEADTLAALPQVVDKATAGDAADAAWAAGAARAAAWAAQNIRLEAMLAGLLGVTP